MASLAKFVRIAIASGTVASVTSTIALMLVARAEHKGGLQPANATSHWLNGEAAAAVREADLGHTAVGLATHAAATMLWALPFSGWVMSRRSTDPARALGQALVVSAVAAAVDYGATPKRFTPGWEFVLSKRSMGVAYAAMAVGLAAGAVMTHGRKGSQLWSR